MKYVPIVNRLSGIFRVQRFPSDSTEVVGEQHFIDCSADPHTFDNWRVVEHKKGGRLLWDISKIDFYLSDRQKGSGVIRGLKLYQELSDMYVLNATVLDYLLVHPHLISEKLKLAEKRIFPSIYFWGTIYSNHSSGDLYVRYLTWREDRLGWGYSWLGCDWNSSKPAAVLAS